MDTKRWDLFRWVLAGFMIIIPGQALTQDVPGEESKAEKVITGFQFTEGPYWHPDGYLLFSDIPANTIYKWTPGDEDAEVFMNPTGHSNGITSRPDGNLILAQHDGMVSMVNSNKKVVVLAKSYDGKRLNSPNDVAVSSDGTIYFTDPTFGVSKENRELSFSGVYKLTGKGEPQLQYDQFDLPNGIVLSPDETIAYVNNTSSGQIQAFDVAENGTLNNPRKFGNVGASDETGGADGMIVDSEGRLYSTGPGGIYVFSPEGKLLNKIDLPVRATNLAWGGPDGHTIYITTPSAIYRLKMESGGVNR